MLQENIGLKVLSLIIAIFVLIQSLLISEQRSVVNLPLALLSIPQNITLEDFPKTIPFQVRGRGLEIIKLKLSRTKVFIDASKIKPGTDIISLSDYTINLPDNIQLEIIGPVNTQEIAVHSDLFYQKKVPVELTFSDNQTRERFYSMNYSIIPERVTVFGPKSKVHLIDRVSTESITASMLDQSELTLLLNPLGNDVSSSVKQIKVIISSSSNTTRVIDNLPITVTQEKKCIPSTVTVKISGDSKEMININPSDINIGIANEPDEYGFYSVTVKIPEGLQLIEVTPQKVRLK